MNEAQVPDVAGGNTLEKIRTTCLVTHDGTRLSPKEDKFISLYIKYSDHIRAAEEAGYLIRAERKNKQLAYARKGKELLSKDYIKAEIAARMKEIDKANIADAQEVLAYLTRVMRGEEKDQFGLDASLAERTSAAKELNRRLKEMEDGEASGGREVHLVLRRE